MAWFAADVPVSSDASLDGRDKPFLLSTCANAGEVKTIIAGHSHTMALSHALVRPPQEGEPSSRAIEMGRKAGLAGLSGMRLGTSSRIGSLTRELGRSKGIAIVWNGSQIYQQLLFTAGPQMDLMPLGFENRDLLPDAWIVPESAIRAQFANSLAELDDLLKALGPSSPGRVRMVMGTPPTIADDAVFRARVVAQPVFMEKAARRGLDAQTVAITPAIVRLKLWFVLQSMMRDMAVRNGAVFVPVTDGARDAAGFLKPEFAGDDATHAKVSYGRMCVERIADLIMERPHG